MRNTCANRRWPVSLYWTIMLSVPAAGMLVALGYYSAYYLIQFLLARGAP